MSSLLRTAPVSSISRLLTRSAWVAAVISVILYGGTAVVIVRTSLAAQARAIRDEREASMKVLVKSEAEKAVAYIERSRSDTTARLRAMLSDRVDEALAIAENITRANRAIRSDADVTRMITDALRPIRFNGGRGYYFATRLDGMEMLFSDRPEMEGRNLLGMTDTRQRHVIGDMLDLVRSRGEGFYSYTWTKPGIDGRDFPKLACVKLFRSLGWMIGTGEYLDDFEREAKQQAVSWLSTVTFGTDGYLFAGQWDGISLMGPAQGQNMISTTDANGVKVVQELIRTARNGGGFVRYVMPAIGGTRRLPKLSYVLSIPEWQWYVGGGQYLADVDAEIRARQASLVAVGLRQAAWLGGVLLVLVGVMLALATANARRIAEEFTLFDRRFRAVAKARLAAPPMESDKLHFSELRSLSLTVNQMLSERAAVEADRARLATAIEQADEMVMITNADLVVLYLNPAYERISGRPRRDALGRRPRYIDHEEPGDNGARQEIEAARAAGQSWSGTIRTSRPDGAAVDLELDLSPVRDPGGRLSNFAIVARDITQRLRMEEQISQGGKMEALGRLAGGVAHDFNNLLQVINGYSELARDELPPGHPSQGHLTEVGTAVSRATDLVRQLLTFSRREVSARRAIDLNDLIADLMKILARLIGEHMEVVVRPASSLPAIAADPGQVRQVLINLCVNARDAMPDGGRILITTSEVHLDERFCAENGLPHAGTYVRLEVADNGTGIAPQIRERIFEPFFTTKDVGKGTGLGLATVYGIVQQHKGLIQVESEVGKGTLFRVFFPCAEQLSETAPDREDAESVSGAGRTVLLAEDERQVRELATRMLERVGYGVIATADGEEALHAYQEHAREIDLVMLDLVMPRIGGSEIRDHLRALRCDLPILLATGYGRDELPREFVPAAHERLLKKPWTQQELLLAVGDLLNPSERRQDTKCQHLKNPS